MKRIFVQIKVSAYVESQQKEACGPDRRPSKMRSDLFTVFDDFGSVLDIFMQVQMQ